MNYRIYFVGADGHFINREDVDAESDKAAIAAARALSKGQAIEVWQRDRLVTKVDARPGSLTPGNLFALFRSGQHRGTSKP